MFLLCPDHIIASTTVVLECLGRRSSNPSTIFNSSLHVLRRAAQ